MKHKLSRKFLWIFLAIIVIIVFFIGSIIFFFSKNKPLGKINGIPFYSEELLMYAEQSRALVSAQYSAKYNISSAGSDFWDTDYGDGSPKKWLLDAAMKELVYNKVIQQECVTRGIVAPADFRELKKAMEQENESRSQALAQGNGVFGTTAYTISQYNDYVMSFAKDDLKAYLLENDLAPTEQQLRDAYDSLDESFKRKDYSCSGFRIVLPNDLIKPKDIQEQITSLISQNYTMEQIAEQLQLEMSPFTFDSSNIHREDTFSSSLNEILFFIEKNEVSPIQYEPETVLYFVAEKNGGGYYSFEESSGLGQNKYINDAFEQFISDKTSAANIVFSESNALKALDKLV